MRLLFLIFTEITKLNTRDMFCNHQIAKSNTRKMYFFSNRKIKYPRNSIPLWYAVTGKIAHYNSFIINKLYKFHII